MSDVPQSSPKKSWVFEEAEKILAHLERKKKQATVIFQTGYGPSGLPHIGTFAEVNRTTFVRHAFETLTKRTTELIAFSDDMDGLRKVPLDIPQKDLMKTFLGAPLCNIPDPFGTKPSYSDHMNGKLIEFLNHHRLQHTYKSSRDQYRSGRFNDGLTRILENVERIKGVILPTLQEEKRKDWSPFMPICEKCGKNLSTLVTEYDIPKKEIAYSCSSTAYENVIGCGFRGKTSILDGKTKVGWKVDWALRWAAFDVDFEMYGKDLIESFNLSKKICKIIGGTPPHDYFYEHFLDEDGKRISKSKGNQGVSVDNWVTYAPLPSLTFYLFNNPRRAKRLYFDIIPKCVDEYLECVKQFPSLPSEEHRRENPVWHIHYPHPEKVHWNGDITFSLIQNLISALATDDRKLIETYIASYDPEAMKFPEMISAMITGSMNYYRDHILPTKSFHVPLENEGRLIRLLSERLKHLGGFHDGELIQREIFAVAKENQIEPKDFFKLLYRTLLGQESGPRLGAFFKLLGKDETIKRLSDASETDR